MQRQTHIDRQPRDRQRDRDGTGKERERQTEKDRKTGKDREANSYTNRRPEIHTQTGQTERQSGR